MTAARDFQRRRYALRCWAHASLSGAHMVPNLLGEQYDTPIGPGVSQAHARRMAARACRGCPNAHACQYGAVCRWPSPADVIGPDFGGAGGD